MNDKFNLNVLEQASGWADKLRVDPAFTDSDAEELKCHLIDLTEDLIESGLNKEEAFAIASLRLGDLSILKSEYQEVNTPIHQMRKAIFVMSGILAFFLLYFFMIFSMRSLVLIFDQISKHAVQNVRYVVSIDIIYHLSVIGSALYIYFLGAKTIKKIERLRLIPRHAFILFIGLIIFSVADQWLRILIGARFEPGSYISNQLYTLFTYTGYTFPLITIICFLTLYKKYYLSTKQGKLNSSFPKEFNLEKDYSGECSSVLFDAEQQKDQINDLRKIGLNDEEVFLVLHRRNGSLSPTGNDITDINSSGNTMSYILKILSGVLVYFFFYFFQNTTARVFFTVLQYFEKAPLLNIKRTWSYVIIFQSLFIFFTVSLYLLDKNIIDRIKQIKVKPVHTLVIFFITILFAFVDRCFYPFSQNAIGSDYEMKTKLFRVFFYSGYSLPFIICACFLVLFSKYYRDNMRIG